MKLSLRNKLLTLVLGIVAALCFVFGAGVVTTVNGEAASATNFKLAPNASIRLNEGSTGIRFTATMDTYDESATYGFVIVPAVYLNGITENYVPALEAKYDTLINLKSNVVESKDGGYEIRGSIANIRYNNIDLDFVGIAYEKNANGNYAYAEFESVDAVARSVYTVATKAYIDDLANDTFDEDDDLIIKGFMDKAVAKKSGITETEFNAGTVGTYKLAFASDTLNANFGEKTAFKFSDDTTADLNSVEFVYDATELTVDEKAFTVTPLKAGELTLTAKVADQTATLIVNSGVPEGYLATFDGEAWVNIISAPNDTYYFDETGEMEVEYLENFQGETGVIKVTGRLNLVNGGVVVKLALPKAHSGKYSIKFWVAETEKNPGLIGFSHTAVLSRIENCFWYSSTLPENNRWHTKVITTSADTSAVYFEAANATGAYLEVYFAFIMDGDIKEVAKPTVAKDLGDSEIANFDSSLYEYLLVTANASNLGTVSVEYLDKYEGETGVLKVTMKHDTVGGADASWVLNLPKAYETGYTIKYRLEDLVVNNAAVDKVATIRWRYANADATVENGVNKETSFVYDMWHAKYIEAPNATCKDAISFYSYGGGGVVMYISGVYNGDNTTEIVEPIRNELAKKITEENVLADFSSDDYLKLITSLTNGNNVSTYSAKILESYTDADGVTKNGVLELKLTFPTTGWRFVNFTLPKAYTDRFTIEVAIAEGYTGQFGMGIADTGTSLHDNYSVPGVTITAMNKWSKLTPPAKNFENKNEITIGVVNQKSTSITIYIDCIYNGVVA